MVKLIIGLENYNFVKEKLNQDFMNDNSKLFKIWIVFSLVLLAIGFAIEVYREVVLKYDELQGVKTERMVK